VTETKTTERTEYRIPEQNLGRLRYDIERLNKRARRLSLPEIVVTVLREETEVKTDYAGGAKVEHKYAIVSVTGTTPVLAGWHFIAALKHIEGQVLIKVAAGASLPDKYLKASPDECDHCHLIRRRLAAFVIEHEDGRTAIVGRNCLADYIRTTSPDQLAAQAEFLTSLDFGGYEDEDEAREGGGARGYHRIAAEDLMAFALREIAAHGYISRKRSDPYAKPSVIATVDSISFTSGQPMLTDAERDAARAIIEWAQEWGEAADPSTEDYRYNVGVVSRMEYVEQRAWAIFVSIPSAKERAEEKAAAIAKAKAEDPSVWIGEPKKRAVYTLKMVKPVKIIESRDWGASYLYSFEDEKGNAIRYFASRPLGVDRGSEAETLSPENELLTGHTRPLRVGDVIKAKATVKAHEEWQGHKQTMITRVAVESLLTTTREARGQGNEA
jgi:hypothetical protein